MSYYSRHADRIKERARRRYKSDPEYRAAHIARVQAYKKRKALERQRVRSQNTTKEIWRQFTIGGAVVDCCRIGHLALLIQRSVQTIRLWERAGSFPKSIVFRHNRYYTRPHVEMIVRLWQRYHADLPRFFEEVRTQWNVISSHLSQGEVHGKNPRRNTTDSSTHS
jgi:hypothetical protein